MRLFFFFQAEDGIRDKLVTGVQTCALPIFGARPADLGSGEAAGADDVLAQRDALGTKRSAVDGMVGVALDVHHGWLDVLRLVAERVDDDAARDGAIGTGASGLRGPGDL